MIQSVPLYIARKQVVDSPKRVGYCCLTEAIHEAVNDESIRVVVVFVHDVIQCCPFHSLTIELSEKFFLVVIFFTMTCESASLFLSRTACHVVASLITF